MNAFKKSFLIPFNIDIDPIQRLILINIEKDPDDHYIGFEPQVFDDDINGSGHLVIAWRKDKKIDVYHQNTLKINPNKYSIAGNGLEDKVTTEFNNNEFIIDDNFVQLKYEFTDKYHRKIYLEVREKKTKKGKPFGLLAPMANDALHPDSLPLVFLRDFYFVKKNETFFHIDINGRMHKPDELPIPLDWSKMYFTRYSPHPIVATINPAYDGKLFDVELEYGQNTCIKNGLEFEFEWQEYSPQLVKVCKRYKEDTIEILLKPGLFDLRTFEGKNLKHEFIISSHKSLGTVEGQIDIQNTDDQIEIIMNPGYGWKPIITKLSILFLFTVAKVFKNWPKTYLWIAKISKDNKGDFIMKSAWSRL